MLSRRAAGRWMSWACRSVGRSRSLGTRWADGPRSLHCLGGVFGRKKGGNGREVALASHIRLRDLSRLLGRPAKALQKLVSVREQRKFFYRQYVPLTEDGWVDMESVWSAEAPLGGDDGETVLVEFAVTSPSQIILDYATASAVAESLGFTPVFACPDPSEMRTPALRVGDRGMARAVEEARERTPVVAVMGHIDHGKTTLLDTLSGSAVAPAEPGQITQRLSAFPLVLPRPAGGAGAGAPLPTPRLWSRAWFDPETRRPRGDNRRISADARQAEAAKVARMEARWRRRQRDQRQDGGDGDGEVTPMRVTFLDTPGHAAFFHMRENTVVATDVVLVVVDGTEGMQSQAWECLNAARALELPVVVAVNKLDLIPEAQHTSACTAVANDIASYAEQVQAVVGISALTGDGLDTLERVLVDVARAQVADAGTSSPSEHTEATVIEASLEKSRGTVLRVIVNKGMVSKGQSYVCGLLGGRIISVLDHRRQQVRVAGPGDAVELMCNVKKSARGISSVNDAPPLGETLHVVDEADAQRVVSYRQTVAEWRMNLATHAVVVPDEALPMPLKAADVAPDLSGEEGEAWEPVPVPQRSPVLLKVDKAGSLVTFLDAIGNAGDDCETDLSFYGIGDVNMTDLQHAQIEKGTPILCFNVGADAEVRKQAEEMGVPIKCYDVFWELLEDMGVGGHASK